MLPQLVLSISAASWLGFNKSLKRKLESLGLLLLMLKPKQMHIDNLCDENPAFAQAVF